VKRELQKMEKCEAHLAPESLKEGKISLEGELPSAGEKSLWRTSGKGDWVVKMNVKGEGSLLFYGQILVKRDPTHKKGGGTVGGAAIGRVVWYQV